jgi:hypothetical protein
VLVEPDAEAIARRSRDLRAVGVEVEVGDEAIAELVEREAARLGDGGDFRAGLGLEVGEADALGDGREVHEGYVAADPGEHIEAGFGARGGFFAGPGADLGGELAGRGVAADLGERGHGPGLLERSARREPRGEDRPREVGERGGSQTSRTIEMPA